MSKSPRDDWKRWFVPGVFPMTLLEIAADRGFSMTELLARAKIAMAPGEIFETGLSFEQQDELMHVVGQALDDPRLGVEMGWRLPPTALGSVGYAVLSSATGAEALEVTQRFWPLVGRATILTIDTRGEITSIGIAVRLPMDEARRIMLIESTFVSIYRGVLALVPDATEDTEVWFDFPEPLQAAHVRMRLGVVRYDMPACQFRFPTRFLSRPLPMANPVALRAAVKWCEREETERGLAEARWTDRVQADLKAGPGGYASLEQIARRLGMAPRTLRRRLREEGTRYSVLLETARRRDALRLLENPSLTAQQIAEMLGYLDPANFTRAFRRWTRQTPSAYRRALARGTAPNAPDAPDATSDG